jgi:hypothetical protein
MRKLSRSFRAHALSLSVSLSPSLSRILTAISHLLVSSGIHAMIYCFILDTNPSMAETTPAQPISALDMCKSAIEQFLLKLRATGVGLGKFGCFFPLGSAATFGHIRRIVGYNSAKIRLQFGYY